ncbi:MAG: hypothetical protein J6X18_09965 [Bacteroidales bacterium]|nr:hypothetical protein [Bacteroidales bacterium]
MKKIFLVYLVCIAFCSCEKDDTNKRNGNEKTSCPIIVHNNDCITIKRFYKSDAAVYPPMYKEILLFRVK